MSADHPGLGSTLRTRPTLLFRVRDWQDGASWEEFHRLYHRLIYGRARRAGLDHADAQDVTQEVLKRVAESIREFEFDAKRGSFRGWLMHQTQWRIGDKFESKARQPAVGPAPKLNDPTALGTAEIERVPAPVADEDEWDREWRQHVLAMALERLARQVKAQHFQAFELYVRQGWPVMRVSSKLGINPASVYVIGHRLTKLLKVEVEKLQQQVG